MSVVQVCVVSAAENTKTFASGGATPGGPRMRKLVVSTTERNVKWGHSCSGALTGVKSKVLLPQCHSFEWEFLAMKD